MITVNAEELLYYINNGISVQQDIAGTIQISQNQPDVLYSDIIVSEDIICHSKPPPDRTYTFIRCKFNNQLNLDFDARKLSLTECEIADFTFHGSVGEVSIQKSIFSNALRLHVRLNVKVEINSVTATNILFTESTSLFSLINSKIAGTLTFGENTQITTIKIETSAVMSLFFNNTGGIHMFMVDHSWVSQMKLLQGNYFNDLNISNSKIRINDFIGSKIVGSIRYIGSRVNQFNFDGHSTPLVMSLEKGKFEQLKIELKENQNFKIVETTVNRLEINGLLTEKASLNIQLAKIKELIFKDFENRGSFRMANIQPVKDQKLSIIESNMGKADLIKCNFNEAKFSFVNSKISEMFLAQTDFPKIAHDENDVSYPQAKLAYGQLVTTFQKQGDNIRAIEYQAREVESHFYDITWVYFFDKLTLGLNWLSNDFGRSWIRGIVFTFGLGLVFYHAFIMATDQYSYSCSSFDWDPNFVGSYLRFMNPIRFVDADDLVKKLKGVTLNNWSYWWDFVGRVIAAYGFYQTIAAFRKYGKKS